MKLRKYIIIILLLLLIFTSPVLSGENPNEKMVNIDLSGEYSINGMHKIDAQGYLAGESVSSIVEEDVKNSLAPCLQFGVSFSKIMEFGIGAKYQLPRKRKDYPGYFNFIPIYFFCRATSKNFENMEPYIIGQVGYNHFVGDDVYKGIGVLTDKYYYGLGIGFVFLKRINMGIFYSVNSGSYNLDYEDNNLQADLQYSKIILSLGFKISKEQ